jgi:hypothetical protein
MQPLLQRATIHLKKPRNVGALGIMTWVVGANAGAALAQHLNQIVAGAISDCIGSQILQSVSYLPRWIVVASTTTSLRFR